MYCVRGVMAATSRLTASALVLVGGASASAVVNWWAVWVGRRKVEWVVKPLTLALLIGVALTLHPSNTAVRAWFVAGLLLSLAGDVFLMLPRERFVGGLLSFLLGHLAYIVGLALSFHSATLVAVGGGLVAVALSVVGRRIVAAVRVTEPAFVLPVVVYISVISLMVVTAFGTADAVAIGGALLFYVSDAVLAWNKFVKPFRAGRVAIMSTYHLAQLGLVLSLVS